jgi:nucleoside 2-deoxyribosyltransferase
LVKLADLEKIGIIMGHCLFTNEEIETSRFENTHDGYYISETLGHYLVSNLLERTLRWKKDKNEKISKQGLINCACRCLEVERNGSIPFWVMREQVNAYRKAYEQRPGMTFCVFEDVLEEQVDHAEKPYQLLKKIAGKANVIGAYETINIELKHVYLSKIVPGTEMWPIFDYLVTSGYLRNVPAIGQNITGIWSGANAQMTIMGWEEIRKRNLSVNSKKVFIAMQFKWEGQEELREQVFQKIQEACSEHGYEADLVDQNHTGNVTDQIIADIKKSRFVVAEFTYNNRGVYFEAGFARGLDIPVFHVIQEGHADGEEKDGKKVHFDIQQVMYRKWRNPAELKIELSNWILARVGKYGEIK